MSDKNQSHVIGYCGVQLDYITLQNINSLVMNTRLVKIKAYGEGQRCGGEANGCNRETQETSDDRTVLMLWWIHKYECIIKLSRLGAYKTM